MKDSVTWYPSLGEALEAICGAGYRLKNVQRVFGGDEVPEVLLSGNHGEIDLWRWEQSLSLTKERRPDLFEAYVDSEPALTKKQKAILEKYR